MSLLKNKRRYIFEVVVARRAAGIGRKRTTPSGTSLIKPTLSSVSEATLDRNFRNSADVRPDNCTRTIRATTYAAIFAGFTSCTRDRRQKLGRAFGCRRPGRWWVAVDCR